MFVTYAIKLHLTCPACHAATAVNAVAPHVTCHACGTVTPLDTGLWAHVSPEGVRGKTELVVDAHHERVTAPLCVACRAPLALANLEAGVLACGCKHEARVRHPGALDHQLHRQAAWIVGETGTTSATRAQPVVFACQKCGGSLEVDGRERTVQCTYCSVANFLPDALWHVLHPTPIAHPFYIVCEYADERAVRWIDQGTREHDARTALDEAGFAILAHDEVEAVRKRVALSPHVSPALLVELARGDPSHDIRACAIKNRHFPRAELVHIVNDHHRHVREVLADLPNLPLEVVEAMAKSGAAKLRIAALAHAALPDERVLALATDGDHAVKAAAEKVVHARGLDKKPDTKPGFFARLFK